MELEIFTLCDFAKSQGGKLILFGPFDAIFTDKEPYIHRTCSLAMRIRFTRTEEGQHPFKLNILDQDGNRVFEELAGNIKVKLRVGMLSAATDISIDIHNLKFPKFGEYSVRLTLDGREEKPLPIQILRSTQPEDADKASD